MKELYSWLLSGDPSIAFLTKRELLENEDLSDSSKIGEYGWCAEYLKHRNSDGSWGQNFYQPKWISTHYTLLELRNFEYDYNDKKIRNEIERASRTEFLNATLGKKIPIGSDVCVCGMFLNYASYFKINEINLQHIIDFILSQKMTDGGFNCDHIRYEIKHSSLHSTLSVLEGFNSYCANNYTYRKDEIKNAIKSCVDFILEHKLYRSSTTNEIIDQKFLRMTYPFRWKYTVLRALNCFVDMNIKYDERMNDALNFIKLKRKKEGYWLLQSKFTGKEYFQLEDAGKPSRVITYLALRIMKKYERNITNASSG